MVSDPPRVTFVIFAYNQENLVGEAMLSALGQDYPNVDYIFSDDCSPDETLLRMKEIAAASDKARRCTVRSTPRNLGLSGHLMDVISRITSEYIIIAAGDDISEPRKIELLLAPLIADPSVMGVHSAIMEMSPTGEPLKRRDSPYRDQLTSFSFVVANAASVTVQSHACRRKVFDAFPPLDPSVTNEGIVLTARQLLLGKIVYVPEVLTRYRLGGISTQSNLTLARRKLDEPIKVVTWYLSALSQIRRDIAYAGIAVSTEDRKLLDRRIMHFEKLLRINKRPRAFRELLWIAAHRTGLSVALRAFARRNLPNRLYALMSRPR